jgi:hypothetical protein
MKSIKGFWRKTEQVWIALFFLLMTVAFAFSFVKSLSDESFANYMTEMLSTAMGTGTNLWFTYAISGIFLLGVLYFTVVDPIVENLKSKKKN